MSGHTPVPEKCDRCDEPIRPVILGQGIAARLTGDIARVVYKITWTSIREQWMARTSAESVRFTHTEVSLCDECWGALLSWVNQPQQERLKIAAENRRYRQRVAEVAEQRREREIQKLLKEDDQ